MRLFTISIGLGIALSVASCDRHQPDTMTFFVTSVPAGDGGNLGGLVGADAHCQTLAEAAGSRNRQWRAYLSTAAEGGQAAVNARDRLGNGPWHNARGVLIASSLQHLHSDSNHISRPNAMQEHGERVFFPHDILTGSEADGTVASGDATCGNWTSTAGRAVFGHSDKVGNIGPTSNSWNSAHLSNGCTLAKLQETGSGGLFYCFAMN